MKAGRSLDARVAVDIMGWRRNVVPGGWNWFDAEGRFYFQCPRYSTSISDAWMVVEKLRAGGFGVAHQGPFPPEFGGREWWEFRHDDGRGGQVYEDDDALAICLAALKAVGVEV